MDRNTFNKQNDMFRDVYELPRTITDNIINFLISKSKKRKMKLLIGIKILKRLSKKYKNSKDNNERNIAKAINIVLDELYKKKS